MVLDDHTHIFGDLSRGDAAWILIVDDDPGIAELLQVLVERLTAMPVATCLAGDVALGMLERRARPTIAICDVMLPGVDGVEVARAIRQKPGGEHTRLLFFSALPQERIATEISMLDPVAYIQKPVPIVELQQVLGAALDSAAESMEIDAELLEEISVCLAGEVSESVEIEWSDPVSLSDDLSISGERSEDSQTSGAHGR